MVSHGMLDYFESQAVLLGGLGSIRSGAAMVDIG